jgi:hypothetical protein
LFDRAAQLPALTRLKEITMHLSNGRLALSGLFLLAACERPTTQTFGAPPPASEQSPPAANSGRSMAHGPSALRTLSFGRTAPVTPTCTPGTPVTPDASAWFLAGADPNDYDLSGSASAETLTARVASPADFSTVMQEIDATPYRGATLQFSATVDAQIASGDAALWMRIDLPNGNYLLDNMDGHTLHGTETVTPAIVLDVPHDAIDVAFGMLLQGGGSVSMSAPTLQTVCSSVTTPPPSCPGALVTPAGDQWFLAGLDPQEYTMSVSQGTEALAANVSVPQDFSTVMQMIDATPFRGTRVRFSADVTSAITGPPVHAADDSESSAGWAGLWMRVDGPSGQAEAFDNMQNRPILGSGNATDSVVLDVPADAQWVAFGVLLDGGGSVSLQNATLQIVCTDVPTTDLLGGVTPTDWILRGSAPQLYTMSVNGDPTASGSLLLSSSTATVGVFGTAMRIEDASTHIGQRIRFAADVQLTNVGGWAGLWMRVDGNNGDMLGFDNMSDRPLSGTTSASPTVVLDIPQGAQDIAFGVLLVGSGQATLQNVRFETVDTSVPTTNMLH